MQNTWLGSKTDYQRKALHNFPGGPRRRAWVWAFEAAEGASGGAAEGEERGCGEKSW